MKLLEPIKVCEHYLRVAGLQQDEAHSKWNRFKSHLIHIPSDILILSLFISLYQSERFFDQIALLSLISSGLCFWMKLINYTLRSRKVKELINDLRNIVTLSSVPEQYKRRVIRKTIDPIIKLLKFLLIFVFLNLLMQIAMMPFRALFCRTYYPFDIDDSTSGFFIAAVHQMYAIFYTAIVWNLLDNMLIILMIYAVGLLDELALRLEMMDRDTKVEELWKCVKIYELIKSYIAGVQQVFGIVIFVQGSLNSFTICSSIITITRSVNISGIFFNGFFCVPMIFEMFVPCYVGQRLIDSSEDVKNSLKNSRLNQREDLEMKNCLRAFRGILTEPIQISLINGLFNVNLSTFKCIIISSYIMFLFAQRLCDILAVF